MRLFSKLTRKTSKPTQQYKATRKLKSAAELAPYDIITIKSTKHQVHMIDVLPGGRILVLFHDWHPMEFTATEAFLVE